MPVFPSRTAEKPKRWTSSQIRLRFASPILQSVPTFQRVQELRCNKRRPARTGRRNLFSGVAYCADCGEKLYYCTTQNFEERQDHFVCSTSRKKGKDVCRTHFIRAVVLEKGVLKFLQILLCYISGKINDSWFENCPLPMRMSERG